MNSLRKIKTSYQERPIRSELFRIRNFRLVVSLKDFLSRNTKFVRFMRQYSTALDIFHSSAVSVSRWRKTADHFNSIKSNSNSKTKAETREPIEKSMTSTVEFVQWKRLQRVTDRQINSNRIRSRLHRIIQVEYRWEKTQHKQKSSH